ncbi:MAG TPA: Gfo/Idh/MocA family oxidoreductase [Candidatus Paceibacterota bacterium]|nr:Gfo/Idh/MocA family oxidoreductase [Candidatus Paceibacterota bacterium]
MTKKNQEKLNISQVGYKSEWALAKFFDAYFNDNEIKGKFNLKYICGRQRKKIAIDQLMDGLEGKLEILFENPTWRAGNRKKEVKSIIGIIRRLNNNGFKYSQTIENKEECKKYSLEEKVYDKSDAIIVQSANLAHLDYINDAISHEKSVLCEKPLIPVIENGKPTKKYINELKKIANKNERKDKDIKILMDAEHYSYKKSSLAFYENLDEILTGKDGEKLKIKEIVGEGIEIDDPSHWRTQEILNFEKSGSGLMGDTLCHFLAFVSNLGGKAIAKNREYDMYEGEKEGKRIKYNADTYDHVVFNVQNRKNKVENSIAIDSKRDYFTEECTANFTVAKFIDKTNRNINKENHEKKESKFIKFLLNDGSEVIVDFITGEVTKNTIKQDQKSYKAKEGTSNNEYVNILNRFYDSIKTGKRPITDFKNSIETMNSIYEAYNLPEEQNKRISVYQLK